MLSFFEMCGLVEADNPTGDAQMRRQAAMWAKRMMAGPGGNTAGVEPDPKDVEMFYNAIKKGEDPRSLLGPMWKKSRHIQTTGPSDNLYGGGGKEYQQWLYGDKPKDDIETFDDTGALLSKLRDAGQEGAEDARIMYHIINKHLDFFKSREFTPDEFLFALKRFGYKEHGMDRTLDPQRYFAALKILAKGVDAPVIQVNPQHRTISLTPAAPEGAKAKEALKGAGRDAARRVLDTAEGDYEPGKAHPGLRYPTLDPKHSVAGQGEISPYLEKLIQNTQEGLAQALSMASQAKTMKFGDGETLLPMVDKIKKQVMELMKAPIPEQTRQAIVQQYRDLDSQISEVFPILQSNQPNPLKDAKAAYEKVAHAIHKFMNSGEAEAYTHEADQMLHDAELAVRKLLQHPGLDQHPATAQEAKRLMAAVKTIDKEWIEFITRSKAPVQPAKPAAPTPAPQAGVKPAVPVKKRMLFQKPQPPAKPRVDTKPGMTANDLFQ